MNAGYYRVDQLPFASMHEADRHFLASLRSMEMWQLKSLRARMLWSSEPHWKEVACEREIGKRGER